MEENQVNEKKGSNIMVIVVGVIVIFAIVGGGAFYFLNGQSTESIAEPTPVSNTQVAHDTPAPGPEDETEGTVEADKDVKVFEVDGQNFSFSLDEITVNEGDTVRIVFNNVSGTHDWTIDEFDANTEIIKTGEADTVEFIANQAGEFEYYCSVGNHRAQGMVGTLVVN